MRTGGLKDNKGTLGAENTLKFKGNNILIEQIMKIVLTVYRYSKLQISLDLSSSWSFLYGLW